MKKGKEINLSGLKPASVARVILFIVALVNRFLLSRGMNILQVDEVTANMLADMFVTIMGAICTYYNFSITRAAQESDLLMEELKNPTNEEEIDEEEIYIEDIIEEEIKSIEE